MMAELQESQQNLEEAEEVQRKKFGNRLLTEEEDVFAHNAWDNVDWDAEQEQQALDKVQQNSTDKMTTDKREHYKGKADVHWDAFYETHTNKFFKDRHWLFTEFPELELVNEEPRSIFELGCGVGNTLLPILLKHPQPTLQVFGCDFSARAVNIFRTHPDFDAKRCNVFVMDASQEEWQVPFGEGTQDIIVLIFVLSAIEPAKMQRIARNCFKYLRPGGLVLFRDYGRYDMAQLRFKNGKCLEDNFYVRGDGTMVYFFTQQELRDLFCGAGLTELENVVDRRLQVNRGRRLKMFRVWVQAKFRKPPAGV